MLIVCAVFHLWLFRLLTRNNTTALLDSSGASCKIHGDTNTISSLHVLISAQQT